MSLATSCPACGTVFRVVQDQLKISEGWVRCGHCQEVFNALEGLFDLNRRDTNTHSGSPDIAIPATTNPTDPAWLETRPAMFSDGKVLRERQEALQNRTAPPATPPPPPPAAPSPAAPSPARSLPATRVEISTRRVATWDPSVQEPERGMAPTQPDPGAWRTTSADTTLPVMPQDEEPDLDLFPSGDETAYPSTTLEFRSEAFSAFAAARLQREGRPDVDLALDWPSAPAPLSRTEELQPAPTAPAARVSEPQPEQPPLQQKPEEVEAAAVVVETPEVPVEPVPAPAAAHTGDPESPAAVPWQGPALAQIDDLEKTLDLSAEPLSSLHAPVEAQEVEAPETALVTPLAESPMPPAAAESTTGKRSKKTIPDGGEPSVLPDFVRRADKQARWHRPIVRAALGTVALLLGGVLVAQIGEHWHDLIAARWPATQPLLARGCVQWDCALQPPQQLDALVVDSTALSRPPNGDSYLLGVTLHNRAAHAVAAPHIELSLTDMSGAVVLRRVLTPAEFRQSGLLAASSDASWNLEFTSTNQRIAGYTLAAFYP
ncbi:zinc-ribbon and DUF3426 domain-containing protein [uncultured Sphaerotilus sp.]|uniref:zinc-ribbon and DUF3426 domain-containing protein n=1 Tax=uncultured Sphaerotilus sp. TaxID=474984 RepID=UPI0030CA2FB1